MSGMERFTQRARRALSLAHQEAERMRHNYIGTEHLLLGLIREEGGVAGRVLRELGLESERVQEIVEKLTGTGQHRGGKLDLSPGTQQVLEYAVDEAWRMGHHYIGTEHLLLGLVRYKEGVAMDVLRKMGITPEQIRRQTRRVLQESTVSRRTSVGETQKSTKQESQKPKTPMVDQLATDLTGLAEKGVFDPMTGFQIETERVKQILTSRTNHNPLLVGGSGTSKTIIMEGLSQQIVEGNVPEPLLSMRIVQIDISSLKAGTTSRGQLEERLKLVIDELITTRSILYIDQVNLLLVGETSEISVDAANILKSALARDELQMIGAVTMDVFNRYIENNAEIRSLFQAVLLEKPSIDEILEILKNKRSQLEEYHRLTISDEALGAAADLSENYLSGDIQPDKAIALLDSACARVRMYKSEAALDAKNLMRELRELRSNHAIALEDNRFDDAQDLLERQESLEHQLERLRTVWDRQSSPVVTSEDIAEEVTVITGILPYQLPGVQPETLFDGSLLVDPELLERDIVGQSEAIKTLSEAIRRGIVFRRQNRPVAALMLLGPTGVGKSELVKVLGRFRNLLQFDMSEFADKQSISRIWGLPIASLDYESAIPSLDKLRHQPSSVVVFDRIEKAHPNIFDQLIHICDKGCLIDALNRKVDFQHAIVILITNVGSEILIDNAQRKGRVDYAEVPKLEEELRQKVEEKLLGIFPPDLISRLDDVVYFLPFCEPDATKIVTLELHKVALRLEEFGISLEASPAAVNKLAKLGYSMDRGAWPLIQIIKQKVENPLSALYLSKKLEFGDAVYVDLENEQILIKNQ